jgi:voltage-dependent calcium channel L type alpha-1D
MTAIVINTLFLCIDYYGKSDSLLYILDTANLFFVIIFTCEMALKITAYGFMYYWHVNWNKFDFIIVVMSLVAVNESLMQSINFNVTALRIIRVSRLLRMVKTSQGLRSLLKTLYMSLSNIL